MNRKFFALALITLALVSGFVAGRASAAQPHMQSALQHLRVARVELNKALADKGGYREQAIKSVADAISEVESGIEYARTH